MFFFPSGKRCFSNLLFPHCQKTVRKVSISLQVIFGRYYFKRTFPQLLLEINPSKSIFCQCGTSVLRRNSISASRPPIVICPTSILGGQAPPGGGVYPREHVASPTLGRGVGVLGWGDYLALSQGEATDGEGDGCVIIVTSFLVAGGHFSPLGSAELPISAT